MEDAIFVYIGVGQMNAWLTVDVRISLEFSPVLIETVYCLQNRMDIAAKSRENPRG